MIGTFVHEPAVHDPSDARRRPKPDSPDPPSARSSFALLLLAKSGDADARERLVARYLFRLTRWAHGRLPAASRPALMTEDLVQDVLLKALEHLDAFEPRHEGAFFAYLRQIAKRRIIDEVKKVNRRPGQIPLEENRPASDPSPLEVAIGREGIERYEQALQRLTEAQQGLVVARLEWGFNTKEIAAEIGKTSGATQVAISRAVYALAREMGRG